VGSRPGLALTGSGDDRRQFFYGTCRVPVNTMLNRFEPIYSAALGALHYARISDITVHERWCADTDVEICWRESSCWCDWPRSDHSFVVIRSDRQLELMTMTKLRVLTRT
jgi:hypothetical protein